MAANLIEELEARHGAMKVCDLTELFGVDNKHIYRTTERGQLPSFHVGSAVRFDPQELAKWLRSKYPVVPYGAKHPPRGETSGALSSDRTSAA